ncbi:kiwellin-like [Syzygium oleosum]|uniref:kiwellin-like n=1 Tax=Syzygium oleosum TaxID=219896 RepID=UPI0024BB07D0|nr:kiwellin-like [Syzygium oleosum]
MKNLATFLDIALFLVISFAFFWSPSLGNSCNGPCQTLNDCDGQLICIKGRCTDDPQVGTHICSNSPPPLPLPPHPPPPPPPSSGGCQPSGTMHCKGHSYPKYDCSPPVTSSTQAILMISNFSKGGDGGGPSECDSKYHENSELIVALSTGWYASGSRCGDRIKIMSTKTGRSVTAKVVDECDSRNGCNKYDYQPPCKNNIVVGSNAVWHALGLDIDVGEENVVWSMPQEIKLVCIMSS